MPTLHTASESTIYTPADHAAISNQIRNRWIAISIPCVVLLAGLIFSLVMRLQTMTILCTILIGALLIFCYDLLVKPLCCYRKHLTSVLYGRSHEAVLPFVALSEDINLVDGVPCRSLTCLDTDAKGRPYDRLFYFDAQKVLPDCREGQLLRIVHHDLLVVDVTPA